MQITRDQIKKIQTLKHQVPHLADRATYEGFLSSSIGRTVLSCTDLTVDEAGRVIDELIAILENRTPTLKYPSPGCASDPLPLRGRGTKAKRGEGGHFPGKPRNMDDEDRGKMLKKIEALLADSKRPWAYVDGMARRMFRVDRIGWCTPDRLHKIIAALEYDKRRREARGAPSPRCASLTRPSASDPLPPAAGEGTSGAR